MQKSPIIYCPNCNSTLEPVFSIQGKLLGHFCLNILKQTCTYINVQRDTNHDNTTAIRPSGSHHRIY